MSRHDFFLLIDQILEVPAGTVKGDAPLAAHPQWDSLALLGLIAAVDKNFGLNLPARQLVTARTANEIAALLGDKITG